MASSELDEARYARGIDQRKVDAEASIMVRLRWWAGRHPTSTCGRLTVQEKIPERVVAGLGLRESRCGVRRFTRMETSGNLLGPG